MISEIFSAESFFWSCLWQSTILLTAGLLCGFLLQRRSARAHRVLFLSMMAAVIVPAASILVKHYELGMFIAKPIVIQPPGEFHVIHEATDVIPDESIELSPASINRDSSPATTGSDALKFPWPSVLLYAWIAVSLILAVRLIVTFVLGARLLRRAMPLDCDKIEHAIGLAKTKLGIIKQVKICDSAKIHSPVIWCWRRTPVLLVPSAAGRLDNGIDWAGVLCHELAHYKRRDHVAGLLAELTVCLLPWQLLLWWAKSRLISLSEQACDDWVVVSGQPGTDYAESLLKLTPEGQMAFVPAVVTSKKGLADRVHRILKDSCGNPRTGKAWALMVRIVAVCLTVGVAFAQTRPLKTIDQNAEESKTDKVRIVHFPKDRSLGMLYMLNANQSDTSSYDDWEPLCEAKGDVTVPAGKALRLDLQKDGGDDLSPLSALKPNDLQMLFCYGVEMVDDEFKYLSHLTGLKELYLRDTGILGTGLKYLAELNSLKRIRVDNTHVGDNELAYLSNLPSLESLNLWGTPTSNAGMFHVGKISSLKELVLSRGVDNEGLAHLENLTSLRYLLLGNQSINDDGLAYLANMTQMETLDLRETQITDDGLVYLEQMKKLKSLILYGTRVTERGFVHLKGLKNLEHLGLPFSLTDVGLEYASQLDSLKNLGINGDSITDKGLAKLTEMKSLDSVSVGGEENTDEIVGKLAVLPGLRSVSLGRGLTDNGFARLKNVKSLQTLSLNRANISGEAMAVLAELPFLRELRILDMNLSGEEYWLSLGKLASLERLDLDIIRSKITDANISHLDGLQSLKVLSMDAVVFKDRKAYTSMDVTDKGLGYLSKLKSLEHLTLHGAKITDEGIQQLSEIPGLKLMDLQGCNVTEEGLQRLKKKLPALHWYL